MTGKISRHAFSGKEVTYYQGTAFHELEAVLPREQVVLLTDSHLAAALPGLFEGWRTIVMQAGEENKQQSTADKIITRLIEMEADRNAILVGVGGGVVTDMAGYVAGIYMRGIRFGLVPTSLLAMVDAAIGGKNGVDVGPYKNLVGLIRQPDFLLFDYSLLQTLPQEQWINGFAEVIKHACIRDAELFALLEQHQPADFMQQPALLAETVERNVAIKTAIVQADEFEQGDRRLLNFGHTLGHAIENTCGLLHGHAVSIGMTAAAALSVQLAGLSAADADRMKSLLQQYQLPVTFPVQPQQVWSVLKMDKKRAGDQMRFILLRSIGEGVVSNIPMAQLGQLLTAAS